VTIAEAIARIGAELDKGNLADYGCTGDDITDESLGSVSRIQVPREQTLTVIRELSIRFLLGDWPPPQSAGDVTSELNEMDHSIRCCVEGLIRLF
jgi:hypothetical protein